MKNIKLEVKLTRLLTYLHPHLGRKSAVEFYWRRWRVIPDTVNNTRQTAGISAINIFDNIRYVCIHCYYFFFLLLMKYRNKLLHLQLLRSEQNVWYNRRSKINSITMNIVFLYLLSVRNPRILFRASIQRCDIPLARGRPRVASCTRYTACREQCWDLSR